MSGFKAIAKKVTPDQILNLYRNRSKTPPALNTDKLLLIDLALRQGAKTFADLGGMWVVNGGYSIYAADHDARQVTVVDFHATREFLAAQKKRKNLAFMERNFALPATSAEVNKVDCVLLFDVLLHQVKPDWDEVLRTYARYANQFLIFNQQFTGAQTVRLVDQGHEWYFRHVPQGLEDISEYRDLFERTNEVHPWYTDGRTYRDMHAVWQWGITDADLKSAMSKLGFEQTYERDCGELPGVEEMRNKAFVFQRTTN